MANDTCRKPRPLTPSQLPRNPFSARAAARGLAKSRPMPLYKSAWGSCLGKQEVAAPLRPSPLSFRKRGPGMPLLRRIATREQRKSDSPLPSPQVRNAREKWTSTSILFVGRQGRDIPAAVLRLTELGSGFALLTSTARCHTSIFYLDSAQNQHGRHHQAGLISCPGAPLSPTDSGARDCYRHERHRLLPAIHPAPVSCSSRPNNSLAPSLFDPQSRYA